MTTLTPREGLTILTVRRTVHYFETRKIIMKINRMGSTRIVFVFKSFVVKIPNILYHRLFLIGCYVNWHERRNWKMFKSVEETKDLLCPTLYCSAFGLLLIQKRAEILPNEHHMTDEELKPFGDFATDIKPQNFGYYKNKLVIVDYGH